jgi:hypothetical protein
MTQKYIIHENCDLYTSHGNIQTYMIYDSFKKGLLGPDFKVAGFKPNGEETSNILDMQEIDAAVGVLIRVSGMGLQDHNIVVYPGQKIMTPDGRAVDVEDFSPNNYAVTINGFLTVDYVANLNDDDLQKFYIIELNDNMKTLFVSNIILFSMEESKKVNPFLDCTQQ